MISNTFKSNKDYAKTSANCESFAEMPLFKTKMRCSPLSQLFWIFS